MSEPRTWGELRNECPTYSKIYQKFLEVIDEVDYDDHEIAEVPVGYLESFKAFEETSSPERMSAIFKCVINFSVILVCEIRGAELNKTSEEINALYVDMYSSMLQYHTAIDKIIKDILVLN
jgi:hypothetical protein